MFQIIITNVLPQLSKQNAMVSIANEVRKHLANCLDLHYVEINISEKNGLYWSDSVHLSDYGLKKYIETLEQKITQVIKDKEFHLSLNDFPLLTESRRNQKERNESGNIKKWNKRKVCAKTPLRITFNKA